MMARRISQARDAAPAMMVTEGGDGVEWWCGGGEAACARGGACAGSGSGAVAFRHKAAVARREAQRRAGRSAARGGRLAAHVRARERRGTGAVPSAPGGCACVRVDACMPPRPRSGRHLAVTPAITAHEPGTGAVPAGLLRRLAGKNACPPAHLVYTSTTLASTDLTTPHRTRTHHTTPHQTPLDTSCAAGRLDASSATTMPDSPPPTRHRGPGPHALPHKAHHLLSPPSHPPFCPRLPPHRAFPASGQALVLRVLGWAQHRLGLADAHPV